MRKEERDLKDAGEMGRTEPVRWRVMLGWVRLKGDEVTLAMSIGAEEEEGGVLEAGVRVVRLEIVLVR